MAAYSDILESLAGHVPAFQECCTQHRDTGTTDTGAAYIVFPNGYVFLYDRYNRQDGPFALYRPDPNLPTEFDMKWTSYAKILQVLQRFNIADNEKVIIRCVVHTTNLSALQEACKPVKEVVAVQNTARWLKLTEMKVGLYDRMHAQAEAHYTLVTHDDTW